MVRSLFVELIVVSSPAEVAFPARNLGWDENLFHESFGGV